MTATEQNPFNDLVASGCAHLKCSLEKVPLVEDLNWSLAAPGHWRLRFAIRTEPPLAWAVIKRLAYCINSCPPEGRKRNPFVFKPEGEEMRWQGRDDAVYWHIESTIPLLNPADVAEHLEKFLLSKIHTEKDWLEY